MNLTTGQQTTAGATMDGSVPVRCERLWFVVQSAMHAERKAKDFLTDAGHETYLPIMRKDVWSRRGKIFKPREFLLFNRYLFARLPTNTRLWGFLLDNEEVELQVLGNNGKPSPIKEVEMARLLKADEEMLFDETREAKIKRKEIGRTKRETTLMRFKPGSRIRATGGPFGGFSGLVTNVNARGAINAMIELFGGMTPVEFRVEMVEPA